MMRVLLMREAEHIVRAGGIGSAVVAHALWLSLFLAVWGRSTGTPLMRGVTIYEQLLHVQWMLMIVLLPWAAARAITIERGDTLVRTTALLAQRPSLVLAARLVALSMALIVVAATGLPMVVIAQRMSDVPWSSVASDQSALLACAIAVAMVVVALQQTVSSRVVVWLAATAITWLLIIALQQVALTATMVAGVLVLVALVGAILVMRRSDVSLRYLSEPAA